MGKFCNEITVFLKELLHTYLGIFRPTLGNDFHPKMKVKEATIFQQLWGEGCGVRVVG